MKRLRPFAVTMGFAVALAGGRVHAQTFDAVWSVAKEQAPRLKLLNEVLHQRRGQTLQVKALDDPVLSWEWEENPGISPTSATNQKFGIQQEFPFPGVRGTRQKISVFGEKLAKEEITRQTRLLRRDVAKAYYTLVLRQHIISYLQSARKQVKQTLESTLLLYQGGKVGMADVLRLRLENSELQNEIVLHNQKKFEAESEIRIVAGLPSDYILDAVEWTLLASIPESIEITKDRLLEESALLKQQKILVNQAKTEKTLAALSYLPVFDLGVAYQRFEDAGQTQNGWAGEIGLTLPLWFWNRQRGERIESAARLSQRLIQRTSVRAALEARINQAYRQFELRLQVQGRFQKTILKDAKDAVANGLTQYQNGKMTALELLDLLRTQRRAFVSFEEAVFEVLVAYERLQAIANEEIEL